ARSSVTADCSVRHRGPRLAPRPTTTGSGFDIGGFPGVMIAPHARHDLRGNGPLSADHRADPRGHLADDARTPDLIAPPWSVKIGAVGPPRAGSGGNGVVSPRLKSVEDRDAAPPQQLESDGAVPSEPAPSRHPGLIFVCDPSAEAERLRPARRSRGDPALDVPLRLLPSRRRYQVPDLVVGDADAPEVLDQVRERRANEATRDVQVVFLGSEEGALQRDPAFRA